MRLRPLLALTGPVLLMLPGCTSDLPAPTNYVPPEPLRPANELVVDCAMLPLTAKGARYEQTPENDPDGDGPYKITGRLDDFTYVYSATGELPAGLILDEQTGQLSGTVEADPNVYTFDINVEDQDDPDRYSATGTCSITVNQQLNAPLSLDMTPYCLRMDDSDTLLSLVLPDTGDGSPITCDAPGGNGNGRRPSGIEVDSETCRLTGAIDEERRGTWVFMVRGTQSGREVFVPYCVTNDAPQGYDITASHSGLDNAELIPVVRTYDPTMPFEFYDETEPDPRYDVLSPGTCDSQCWFSFSYSRTLAPVQRIQAVDEDPCRSNEDGFCLAPSRLIGEAPHDGFLHGIYVSGPAVPEEFRERSWILSTAVSYCIADSNEGCDDVQAQGDGALEFGLIMVPE
ncbi:MAG: Ig domain-containing protein [Myxococcota bacterium]